MSSQKRSFLLLFGILMISSLKLLTAQEPIPWLADFTSEMIVGNNSYQYSFKHVDGKDCKVEFDELFTNKKGAKKGHSWIFYLSDIDPASIRLSARGKSVEINMETVGSQKFISHYEGQEFDEYTAKIKLVMNDVNQSRQLMDAVKEHIAPCMEADAVWNDRNSAFNWLVENIGDARDDEVEWEQDFSEGEKPYLASLSSKSMDNGKEETLDFIFDLSDIDPLGVKLEASGKTLNVKVPVREGHEFIEENSSAGRQYVDELKIYADDIETARQIVNAMTYLVSNTTADRPTWDSYGDALEFVKEALGEVQIGDEKFQHSLDFEDAPSGILELSINNIEADGESKEESYSFYLIDMLESPALDVSRKQISIEVQSRDKLKYIMKFSGGSVDGYASEFEFNAASIDLARDVILALSYAIEQSEEEIQAFSSVEEVNGWMEKNLVTLFREGEQYEQKLSVDNDFPNRITFEQKLTEDEGETTDEKFLIYPVDVSLEKLKIAVSMGRLKISLLTEREDYFKYFKNGALENFTDKTDVFFSDPLVAKNFMAAIRFLNEHAAGGEAVDLSMDEAFELLNESIPDLEVDGEKHEQKLEIMDGEQCKLKFTRVENEDDGKSNKFVYEFMAADISTVDSELSVDGKIIEVNLKTAGKKKLIKPYKNSEVEDFDDEFAIYADDVWQARLILASFGVLSEACQ